MRIDDLKDYLVANLNPFIAALSTVALPLEAITAAQVMLLELIERAQPVTLYLDDEPEEIQDLTTLTRDVTWKVNAYWFISRYGTEAAMRDRGERYARALVDCLALHPDFFGIEGREFYNGVEGRPDEKASKVTLVFRFEEPR